MTQLGASGVANALDAAGKLQAPPTDSLLKPVLLYTLTICVSRELSGDARGAIHARGLHLVACGKSTRCTAFHRV